MNTIIQKMLSTLLKKLKVTCKPISKKQNFKQKHVHDPSYSYMNDPKHRNNLIDELAKIAQTHFSQNFSHFQLPQAGFVHYAKDFFNIYSDRRLVDNSGGSGFHNSFWLYLFTKTLKPNLIVESGVWKGHTTWLLQKANANSRIIGFDTNLKHLEFKSDVVMFIENDWDNYQFAKFDPDKSLVFFDCHVNHAKRILEAHKKGFKHLIFDDNPPIYKLYSYGKPGLPTAHMLVNQTFLEINKISWTWKDQKITKIFDIKEAKQASRIIKKHILFPDVGGPTRYGGFSFLTYIKI